MTAEISVIYSSLSDTFWIKKYRKIVCGESEGGVNSRQTQAHRQGGDKRVNCPSPVAGGGGTRIRGPARTVFGPGQTLQSASFIICISVVLSLLLRFLFQ